MKLKIISFLTFLITLNSCEKEKFQIQSKLTEETMIQARKTFASVSDLSYYLDNYKKDSVKFRSNNETEISSSALTLVEDEAGASLFNDNGELTVGDITYKITNVGTFYAKNQDFWKVDQFIKKDDLLFLKLLKEDYSSIPEILYVNRPDLRTAELVDKKLSIYRLTQGVFYKDGIEDSEEIVGDKNNMTSEYSYPTFRSNSSHYLPPEVFNGVSFSNAVTKEFTDKNGTVLNNFGKKDRLVVQIKSKNFVIFSYMKTVVRIDHKKRLWFGWRTLQNYDELRAGFVNLVLDFNLPNVSDPLLDKGNSPNIIDNGVSTYLKSIGNVKLDNDAFDVYRISDVLNLPHLPFNIRTSVENILDNPESFYSDILNGAKNKAMNEITSYMKTQIDPMLSKNNFSFVIPQNNSLVTIPLLEKKKTSRGAIIELKEVQTARVGITFGGRGTNVGFNPSKNPKVISGAIFGAGKLHGQWKTGVLIKNKK